jgi:hypothetical protein
VITVSDCAKDIILETCKRERGREKFIGENDSDFQQELLSACMTPKRDFGGTISSFVLVRLCMRMEAVLVSSCLFKVDEARVRVITSLISYPSSYFVVFATMGS